MNNQLIAVLDDETVNLKHGVARAELAYEFRPTAVQRALGLPLPVGPGWTLKACDSIVKAEGVTQVRARWEKQHLVPSAHFSQNEIFEVSQHIDYPTILSSLGIAKRSGWKIENISISGDVVTVFWSKKVK